MDARARACVCVCVCVLGKVGGVMSAFMSKLLNCEQLRIPLFRNASVPDQFSVSQNRNKHSLQ